MLYQAQCRKIWGAGGGALLLTCWFLLPVLFQTELTFLSGVRLAWEGAYLALSILLVRRSRGLWTGGGWRLLPALAAGAGALYAQNPLLGAALVLLAWRLSGEMTVRPMRGSCGAVLALLSAAVALQLLVTALAAGLGVLPPTYRVPVPGGMPGQFAQVTVLDPGAMGRIRYTAVEQVPLLDLDPLVTISRVTGQDSAPSGEGDYGYVIDWYFAGME